MPCQALISLKEHCKQYLNNPTIVFKSCVYRRHSFIIVLQRIAGTITNEKRDDVLKPNSAKFRGNMFLVLDIIDKFKHKSINLIFTWFEGKQFFYVKGRVSSIFKYTENDFTGEYCDRVCFKGIHFFKSIERAFYHDLPNVENGDYWSFYDNGFPMAKYTYENNKIIGKVKMWNYNGTEFIQNTTTFKYKKTWYEYFSDMVSIKFIYDD